VNERFLNANRARSDWRIGIEKSCPAGFLITSNAPGTNFDDCGLPAEIDL
jgi:hypothetical protein